MPDIRALLSEAASLQSSGSVGQSLSLYEEVFRLTVQSRRAAELTEATRRIGYAHQKCGDIELATEYLELAYTLALLHDDKGSAARALNGLATIYQISGEMSLAGTTYLRASEIADDAADDLAVADIEQNLGTLLNTQGSFDEAMRHYRTSLAKYESIGNLRGVAQVMNNLGVLYLDMSALAEAATCLDRALHISLEIGDTLAAAQAFLNRGELHIDRKEYEFARSCCDQAFEIASNAGDNRTKSEALKYYGVIYRETDKPNLAISHLLEAVELADRYCLPLTEAEALRELALVWRSQDRNKEALEALNRAHSLFSGLQAKNDQADVTRRLRKLEQDFLTIVDYWSSSIEAKDPYTRGHCKRVAEYACIIAERAGLSPAEMIWFRMGAFLHDVGKMEVPEHILHKTGSLTSEERTIIERHTINGHDLLKGIPFPWDICPMVRSHHERWDGAGYPDGLKGKEIPFTARILRIADVYDALTTVRSYRAPLNPMDAREIMYGDRGGFDPDLLSTFDQSFEAIRQLTESSGGNNAAETSASSSHPRSHSATDSPILLVDELG